MPVSVGDMNTIGAIETGGNMPAIARPVGYPVRLGTKYGHVAFRILCTFSSITDNGASGLVFTAHIIKSWHSTND